MRVRVGAHGSLLRVTRLVQPVKGSLRAQQSQYPYATGAERPAHLLWPVPVLESYCSQTVPVRSHSCGKQINKSCQTRKSFAEVDAHLVNVVDDVVPQFVVDLGSSSLVRSRIFRVFL